MKKTINIGSSESNLAASLSNFNQYHFHIDGIFCASMEGFLQSLKFNNIEKQIEVCKLIGVKAKFKGNKRKWFNAQLLYWNGIEIPRGSIYYQDLLDRAFSEIFKNKEYQKNLFNTKNALLIHDIGKSDPTKTVLTIYEFCDRLMKMRDYNKKY